MKKFSSFIPELFLKQPALKDEHSKRYDENHETRQGLAIMQVCALCTTASSHAISPFSSANWPEGIKGKISLSTLSPLLILSLGQNTTKMASGSPKIKLLLYSSF